MYPMLAKTDRFVDVSLRILSATIMLTLIGALILLLYRTVRPEPAPAPATAVVEVTPTPAPVTPKAEPAPQKAEVLHSPGQVFKCTVNGRVTFSEKPCPDARK